MTKKDKRAVSNGFAALFLFVGLFLYWMIFKSNNIYLFFGIIIATPVVERIIYSILPDKKSQKRISGKKNRKNELSSTSSNCLRTDEEIILSNLDELSWREFERLCFLYFKAKGYKPRETGEGADGGVDLVIYNRHHNAEQAIQIKHYIGSGNQITVKEIRELNSAKRNHKCVLSRFITTSSYTKDALKQADDYKVDCHDLNWVKSKIVKWQEQEKKNVV